jgi:hypothetical protein
VPDPKLRAFIAGAPMGCRGVQPMGRCACHPEKESRYQCMKHVLFLCDECLKCRDPSIYCKYRSACPIWYMEKREKRKSGEQFSSEEDAQCGW